MGISKNLKVASLRGRNSLPRELGDRSNRAFAKGMWVSAKGMWESMPLADTHRDAFISFDFEVYLPLD